jgi:hypothetical protein
MKKSRSLILFALLVLFSSCGPKPYYDTRVGRKKQKYYNDIQYGHDSHPKKTW